MTIRDESDAKDIEKRVLKGEQITYDEFTMLWGRSQLAMSWFEGCGFLWRHKRLKPMVLNELTGRWPKGFTKLTGMR